MKQLSAILLILIPIILLGNYHQREIDSINLMLMSRISDIKKIEILTNLGQNNIESNNHTLALDYFLKAIKLCKYTYHDSLKIVCYNQISRIFFYQKNYVKCDYYNELALKSAKKNPLFEGDFYKRKADTYTSQSIFDSAQTYYTISEQLYKKSIQTDSLRMAGLYANLSITYPNDKIKSIEFAYLAKKYFGNNRDSKYYINQGNIGNFYKDIVRYNEFDSLSKLTKYVPNSRAVCIQLGYSFIFDAINLANKASNRTDEAYYHGILSELQEVDGDYKNALQNFKIYYEITDSIYSQDIKNELAETESKIEIEKKNQEIAIKKIQLKSQKRLGIALVLGIILLSTIGLLLYIQSRNRKKNNIVLNQLNTELAKANEIKAKLFGILSHDLRSPIANLITLLQLKKDENFDNIEDEKKYTDNVILSAENLLENMETLLLWSKGQMNNFQPNYQQIPISDLFNYIKHFFAHEKEFPIQFNAPDDLTITSDEVFLQVIMQNLTSNAIKALKNINNPTIQWDAFQSNNGVIIQISDNGLGMDETKLDNLIKTNKTLSQKNGFGLQIVNDLASVINCKLQFKTSINQGFSVLIILSSSNKCNII